MTKQSTLFGLLAAALVAVCLSTPSIAAAQCPPSCSISGGMLFVPYGTTSTVGGVMAFALS